MLLPVFLHDTFYDTSFVALQREERIPNCQMKILMQEQQTSSIQPENLMY